MTDYLARNTVTIGDVRELAARLEPQSVQTIVTSPPYFGLRSYLDADHPSKAQELGGEATPEQFVVHLVAVFAALRPALKNDGTLWVNLGDGYANNPSTTKIPRHEQGNGIGALSGALDPGAEKHHTARRQEANRLTALKGDGLKQKDLIGIPWMVAFALRADGWYLRSDIIWAKPNPMPESVTDRPTRAHEYIFLLSKSARYLYDADAIKEPYADGTADRIGQPSLDAQQGGYKTEAYQQDHPGKKARDRRPADILRAMRDNGQPGRNKRDVWTVTPAQFPGAHFATFAPDLIRPCILAGTSAAGECEKCGKAWIRLVEKEFHLQADVSAARNRRDLENHKGLDSSNGWQDFPRGTTTSITTGWAPQCACDAPTRPQVVLDPFAGSGTTASVAHELGRDWLLTDLDERAIGWTNGRLARMPVGVLPLGA